jgi:hypothetical protein
MPTVLGRPAQGALPASSYFVYKMAGVRLEGSNEDVEFEAGRRIVSHTKGGVESVVRWDFEPHDGGTRLTFQTEYKVPIPVLGKLAEAIIVRLNEHEGEVLRANIKARMEA